MPTIEEHMALLDRVEALHPDLLPYVTKESFGQALNHPLVQQIPFWNTDKCAVINQQYAFKKEAVAKALVDRDWDRHIYLHERPYRLAALMGIVQSTLLPNDVLAQLVADVWTDSENIWQNQTTWKALWGMLEDTSACMSPEDLATLHALPDMLPVYRGLRAPNLNPLGLSWTLDRDKAVFFAKRYSGNNPVVVSGVVPKHRVYAYISERDESEIVVLARWVQNKAQMRL